MEIGKTKVCVKDNHTSLVAFGNQTQTFEEWSRFLGAGRPPVCHDIGRVKGPATLCTPRIGAGVVPYY